MIKYIHLAGQRIFLGLESVLNRAFGPGLNPLYFLGAITYWMFWIIIASGFYIYLFYDTGVADAFDSVERITHEQWYLGGIMRSLHRYASDGLLLAAILHMVRNFAFDRYRNFRWFSWYTGVIAMWLVYMAGINGYWLVWDKLAQFVAVGTAEWLDALPIFSAPLVRNFLEQGSVNDRFFTLLSLIHIGVPLGTFALIWTHTQRVPNAKTSPPKILKTGLVLALIALALVKPAMSQGIADLNAVPSELNLDWFYLWCYPLLYSWGPGKLWGLAGGLTGFLLLLPFLGGRQRNNNGFRITSITSGRSISAQTGETILEAALRQELNLPYQCRDGACGTCKGTILSGRVDYGTYQRTVLSDAEIRDGKALFCCARPLSDLTIECREVKLPGHFPPRIAKFRITRMEQPSSDVMLIELQPEDGPPMKFVPGQHIAILMEDGTRRCFSIANAPHAADRIQLHIRRIVHGKFTTHVFDGMKVGDVLTAEGPLGTFFLREDSNKPIIFMAGGTGFAPVKSMLEHAFSQGIERPIVLYWGARTPVDFYLAGLPNTWQQVHDNFSFVPVVSESQPEQAWAGRTGLVHEAVLQDHADLSAYQIYACGSPEMIETARAQFVTRGLPQDQYFTDAFLFSSAKAKAMKIAATSDREAR